MRQIGYTGDGVILFQSTWHARVSPDPTQESVFLLASLAPIGVARLR